MTKDLTNGSVTRCVIGFAIPVFLGMLFQQLYNMADTIIVGRFLGINPLAGVGATSSLFFLVIGFGNGVTTGFAIPIAQKFGAGDKVGVRMFTINAAYLCIIISIAVGLLTGLLSGTMLRLMNTPSEIYSYAYWYISIVFFGLPFTFLYNMVSAIMRALGDSKTPVVFLVLSSIINVFLDLFCIIVLHMNTEGAAIATVASQAIAGIVALIYMIKKFDILRFSPYESKSPDKDKMGHLLYIGIPMGLQFSITAIGTIIVQTAVNAFGAVAVAGVTAANKLFSLFACIMEAFGPTMATFTGQNYGAGKLDRIDAGLKISTIVGVVTSIMICIFLYFTVDDFSRLFISADQVEAIAYSRKYMMMSAYFFVLLAFVNNFRYSIQGLGYSILAMAAGVIELIGRALVAFIFPSLFGFTGICCANAVAWILVDIFLVPAYIWCKHTTARKMQAAKNRMEI